MKKYTTLLLATSLFLVGTANAQYTISGKVLDAESNALSDINISLLKATDSSWLTTTHSGVDGKYLLQDVVAGKYVLHIQGLGYRDVRRKCTVVDNVVDLNIELIPTAQKLEEAIVKTRRKTIETDFGKTVVNINKEMKVGKDLLELLREVPGVQVSPTGTVSIVGKQGVQVIVNGKPILLTGEALTSYLRSVSANDVDKIELMTQPNAKYDASGNAGVLLVKMNKQKNEGWSGNVNTRYIQSRYPFIGLNGRLAHRKNKATVYIAPGAYRGVGFLIPDKERFSKDITTGERLASIKESGFLKEVFYDYATEVGLDYDISDNTTFSTSIRRVYHPNEEVDSVHSAINDYSTGNAIDNVAIVDRGFIRKNITANVFLSHQIDSNQDLTVKGQYFTESRDIYQNMRSLNYDEQGNSLPNNLVLNNSIPITSSVYNLNVDYTCKIKSVKLDAGVKTSYVPIDDANNIEIQENGAWAKDTLRSNHFVYNESINAAYVNASTKKGKWQAQAGLRVEHTHAKGHELTRDNKFERDYVSVFPTGFVSCKIDDKNTIEANYGRRIKRPFYRELNPFTNFTSQYVQASGNPMLLPMFTHNIELKHNYKGRFITTLSCSQSNNAFTEQLLFDIANKVSNYSTTNNGQNRGGALQAFYNGEIKSWLNVSVTCRAGYNEFQTTYNKKSYHASRTNIYMSVDTQFMLKHGWAASLSTRYTGRYRVDAFREIGGSYWLDSNVSKSMFDDSFVIRLSMRDPFGLYRHNEFVQLPNNEVRSSIQYATQNVALALSYNFGKHNRSNRNKINSEEINRM